MIRIPFVISVFISCAMASTALAQSANGSSISLNAGCAPQTQQVQAVGEHNVADSATLRARGCEGFVATDPSLSITYNAGTSQGAVVVRAESPTDLVMLIGTAANAWFCADDTIGTNPEITLPPGSGSYSVWVGTRQKGRAQATVTMRETRSGGAGQSTVASGGRCGEATARIPMSIATEDWARFSCTGQAEAGARWSQCYGRSVYSDSRADGCPGAELCCPYEGFNLAASQAKAASKQESSTPAASTANTPSATGSTRATTAESSTANTATPAQQTPTRASGPVAAGAPDQLSITANPFGTRGNGTVIYWRGFPDAQIPVRTETRESAPTLYHLKGSDFPRAATDSMIVVKQTRKLRARTATSLNTSDGAIQIPSGQEIELLGPTSTTQCKLRIRQTTHIAACPHDAVFEGVGHPFDGLSPLHYEWWVAAENENLQRGWVRIDLSRPEFIVVLPPSL